MVVTAETGDKIRSLLSSVTGSGAEARVNIEPCEQSSQRIYSVVQWNHFRIRDTMGPMILYLVERSSPSRRSNNNYY